MMNSWAPYVPDAAVPWTRRRVVHLHRRTSFGAPKSVVDQDLADGPEKSVDRLLAGGLVSEASPFEQTAGLIGNAAVDSGSIERLKAWWLYRCLFSPTPLVERLALMWHNHFATSNLKVNDLKSMRAQNESFRQHALGPFDKLLTQLLRDPALLIWLDAPSNQKGKPNENLARELLELFTLGIGNYTEFDIREAARALTGLNVRQGEFHNRSSVHDEGEKTVLGHVGDWGPADLTRLLVDHPATSKRLAWRLTSEFFGEGVVEPAALDELAAGLRERELDIGWAVSTMLRSRLFFCDANIGTRICDPATFLLAPLRSLELTRDPPSTLVLAEWLGRMGLDLFYPPNVGGWTGGRSWLSTRTVIARANYVAALTEGRLSARAAPPDFSKLLGLEGAIASPALTSELSLRMFGDALPMTPPDDEKTRTSSAAALTTVLTSSLAHLN